MGIYGWAFTDGHLLDGDLRAGDLRDGDSRMGGNFSDMGLGI